MTGATNRDAADAERRGTFGHCRAIVRHKAVTGHAITLNRDRVPVDAKPRDLQAKLHAPGRINSDECYSRHDLPLRKIEIRGDESNPGLG